jgi:hypothetical protein
MIRRLVIFLFLVMFCESLFSQEQTKKIIMNGYVSTMMSSMFDTLSGPFLNDNLIHNRLNFKGYISEKITVAMELRNRLFTGDMARAGNTYSSLIGMDQGLADMSWNILNERSFFFNTSIDRLWVDFNFNKVQATIGRQRINWGQALIWNPNDIFNAYSYFDFDYAERPGSDAVRIQFYPKPSSVFELALKGDYNNNVTAAALYRFNKWGYDIQFLGGVFNSDELVVGTGWSGALGATSFRGEVSLFEPFKNFDEGTGMVTMGIDRSFKNNSLAQVQLMFCNKPAGFENFGTLYSGNITVKDLAFSKFSAFGSYSYPITPLFTVTASSMWFPDLKGYFSGLSADYSVAENVDITLLWQHFRGKVNAEPSRINILFLRFKMSF